MTELRQAEPTPWRDMVVVTLVREGIDKHRARELADHFAAQPEQEPVAWVDGSSEWKDWCGRWFGPDADDDYLAKAVFDLPPMAQKFRYTALEQPEQRKPLTANEILNLMPSSIPAEYDGELMEFARAVEAKLKERNT